MPKAGAKKSVLNERQAANDMAGARAAKNKPSASPVNPAEESQQAPPTEHAPLGRESILPPEYEEGAPPRPAEEEEEAPEEAGGGAQREIPKEKQAGAGAELANARQSALGSRGEIANRRRIAEGMVEDIIKKHDIDLNRLATEDGKKISDLKSPQQERLKALGGELRSRITNGSFMYFVPALLLCVIKDAVEIAAILGADPGVLGDVVGLIITPIVVGIFACQKSWLKQKLIQWMGRLLLAVATEFIPVLEVLPIYTFGILYLYVKVTLERMVHIQALTDVEARERRETPPPARVKFAPAASPGAATASAA